MGSRGATFAVVAGLTAPGRCDASLGGDGLSGLVAAREASAPSGRPRLGTAGFARVGRGLSDGLCNANGETSGPRVARFTLSSRSAASPLAGVAFMSLSTSVTRQKQDARLLSTFKEISGDKVSFNQDDLERYAARNGLPSNYVKSFIHAVQKSGGWSLMQAAGDSHITYQKFSKYVATREEALRHAFEALDVDNNGEISVDDMEIALAHVRVKCPDSKCVYQCKRDAVHHFVATVSQGKNRPVNFGEFRAFFLLLPQNDMIMDYFMSTKDSSPCDIGGCVVLHEKTGGNPAGHLLAGAMSGAVSRTFTAPLETLRLMAMTGSMPEGGAMKAAQDVVKSNGWRGLFKGNGVNVMRSAPQKALDFFAFDAFKKVLSKWSHPEGATSSCLLPAPPQMGLLGTLAAAGLAGATSSTILYPLEVVRSRLTVDAAGAYRGVFHAFHTIIKTEGVAALYCGLVPSVAAIIPEAAITYGMFDILKKSYSQMRGVPEPSVFVSLAFGVSSAFMGQVVAYPLETVSRRMQVQQGSQLGALEIARQVVEREGIPGLYGGLKASMLKVLPMAILSFGTYETVRMCLNKAGDKAVGDRARKESIACKRNTD
uniref:EF-hand domain-containing protein n=1 Tax=Tetraselmis chuii TaxID=63592 RepID=A0A7S1SL09_9CHLO|mmetsp:Transcript_16957/g.30293  ORF Transcript_16957/g.30293 Transcript_16957/m.30293 type:complete len:599 (+) Transcript_16957:352-2148(+)